MNSDFIKDQLESSNRILLAGMKAGEAIGWQQGMLKAAELCEAKAKLHQEYLRPGQQYKDTNFDDAATCGRRDECSNLAFELRQAVKAKLAEQLRVPA